MSRDKFNETKAAVYSVYQRIRLIQESVGKESWLPISFRGMVASELPELIKLTRAKGRTGRLRLAKLVCALAVTSLSFNINPLESETISQIRILDLELNADVSSAERDDFLG